MPRMSPPTRVNADTVRRIFLALSRDYPTVLVRLDRVRESELRELLEDTWRQWAPKRLLAEYDAS